MSPAPPATPRELPAPVRHFVGREPEMARLSALFDAASQPGGVAVISAIGGTGGVGKTALAVRWAHQVADRFPDGQLYINLRGYDPGEPLPATEALARFLRALGLAGEAIPAELDDRADAYRALVAGRRMLMLLDNARDAAQVRPLLPGDPGCAVVVTSRDPLAGLVARDGARRLDLDLLPGGAAVGLLRELIGDRVTAEPAAAGGLAAACGRLPLALRVAAELAASRPGEPLRALAGELAQHQRRLDLLTAGDDPRAAVRSVFSWSYHRLPAPTARAFRLLSLHPSGDYDRYAAAALTGMTLAAADQALSALARAYLIQISGSGRCGTHDLLLAYGRELTAEHDSEAERGAARDRLFTYCAATAAAAMDILMPAERDRRPAAPPHTGPVPALSSAPLARAWLDTERPGLLALHAECAQAGRPDRVVTLGGIIWRYLEMSGHLSDEVTIVRRLRRAGQELGDTAVEGLALLLLGAVDQRQGRTGEAVGSLLRSEELSTAAGRPVDAARALSNLAHLRLLRGEYGQARDEAARAVAALRAAGNRLALARALLTRACVDMRQGRYELAMSDASEGRELFQSVGDLTGESYAEADLGRVRQLQGRYPDAQAHLERSLAMQVTRANPTGEVYVLAPLGLVALHLGDGAQAARHLERALELARRIGYRPAAAEALVNLGEVQLAAGRAADALASFTAGLEEATVIGERYEQARAHDGLARVHELAGGDRGQATRHWRKALARYEALGVPAAADIRARTGAKVCR